MAIKGVDNEILIRNSIFSMFLYGKVTAIPGANQFTVPSLRGFPGAGAFASVSNPWQVFVNRKGTGTGAAPQGEQQPVTAYNPTTGTFATSAFSVAIVAGDEVVLVNPVISDVSQFTVLGKMQVLEKTIDLNQAAASYTIFTGTGQVVDLEKLVIQMPTGVPAGALTGISIQTDDATPQPLITAIQGLLVNLTSEGQLTWVGVCRIRVGKHIQLTIVGGATGVSYVCSVDAQCRAVVSGGSLS